MSAGDYIALIIVFFFSHSAVNYNSLTCCLNSLNWNLDISHYLYLLSACLLHCLLVLLHVHLKFNCLCSIFKGEISILVSTLAKILYLQHFDRRLAREEQCQSSSVIVYLILSSIHFDLCLSTKLPTQHRILGPLPAVWYGLCLASQKSERTLSAAYERSREIYTVQN